MLKGFPGVLRDASPDPWRRRVIQTTLEKKESEVSEMACLFGHLPTHTHICARVSN